jgi:hypothetical protein
VVRKGLAFAVLMVVGLGLRPPLQAAPVYTAVTIGIVELNLTITSSGPGTNLWDTLLQATNTGPQTLYNLYEFPDNAQIDGVSSTLVNVGLYQQSPGTETATANNAAIFITASQMSGYTFSAGGAGSPTIPQIPGFLIASSLGSGQSVDFQEDFVLPSTVNGFEYGFVNAATAPEPGSIALLTVGGALLYALRRKRAA